MPVPAQEVPIPEIPCLIVEDEWCGLAPACKPSWLRESEQSRPERVFADWMAPFVDTPDPVLEPVIGATPDLFA